MNKIINAKTGRLFALVSFLTYSLSFLIGHEEEAADHMFLFVKAGLIFISACLFVISVSEESSEKVKTCYAFLSLTVLIYQLMLIWSAGRDVFYIRDHAAILCLIMWTLASLISVVRFRKYIFSFFLRAFSDKDSRCLIIAAAALSAFVIILSAEPEGVRFTWDSDTLYEFIYERGYESLFDAKLLTFHSHVSIVYAYLLVLFKLFFHNIRTGYFVLNALCIIAASFGMLFLLRNIVPGKKNSSYIIADIMFMLSPWVCGMSTYHMYDYYIWCLFPLLILYALKKNWIGFFAAGVLITFSKTTGLAVFGSACIGVLVVDAWSYMKAHEGLAGTVKKLLADIKYWCFLCVLIVFTLFFKLGISEETQFEDTVIGFDAAHTFHQMKLFTFANFIWIFVVCSIILLIRLFITKKTVLGEEQKKALMILLISDAVFFVSNCLIITYRMPRYMDSHIAVVYVFAAVLFLGLDNVKASNILMSVITAVTFIAGFRMIDPLSLAIFSPMDVGTHRIVDFEMTDHPSLEDSIVCNREYYSYEIVLGKALTYVMDSRSPDDGIMFSLGDQALTWGFAGGRYSYNYKDGKKFFEEFYDKKIGGMANGYSYDYYESDDMIPYDMQYIFPNETVKEAADESNSGTFWYIYMPTLNCSKEQEIYNDFNVVSEEQFTFRGWQMNCIRFSRK